MRPALPFASIAASLAASLLIVLSLPLAAQQHAMLAASLPDAPSALLAAADPNASDSSSSDSSVVEATEFFIADPPQAGNAPAVIVNGRPYHRPTPHQELKAYEHDVLLGSRPYIRAAIRSGFEQLRGVPIGWGKDFPGYIQRYGSAFGEGTIESSVRYGLGTLLHEDVHYILCHECSFWGKIENAALFEVTARHGDDGHRTFSMTPIVSSLSGPLVAYAAWYPPGYTSQMALRHVPVNVIIRFIFNVAHEFLSDKDSSPMTP